MITPHFSLEELTASDMADRMGLDNSPGEAEVRNLSSLCVNILEPIRENYGIPFSPSSCFRSSTLNDIVGGASNSQHVDGCAADIEISGVDNLELARWIEVNLSYDQLILEHHVLGDAASGSSTRICCVAVTAVLICSKTTSNEPTASRMCRIAITNPRMPTGRSQSRGFSFRVSPGTSSSAIQIPGARK